MMDGEMRNGVADIRDRVRGVMERDKLSQAEVSGRAGMSPTTLSRWLQGTYAGDSAEIEAKLARWLDADAAEQETRRVMPDGPGFVRTVAAERILEALGYAQVAPDNVAIYGAPGTGKTATIAEYARQRPNVFVATMSPASASVVTCLQEVAAALGLGEVKGGASILYREICRDLRVTHRRALLVIDEAQHLSPAALDQLRAISDAVEVGLALVGNENVYSRFAAGTANMAQLHSRMGRKLRLAKPSKRDVLALAEGWRVPAACTGTLIELAGRPGALRGVVKTIRLAAMRARAKGADICCEDVTDAARELAGGEA